MATKREHIQERLTTVIESLPDRKLEQVADFAEYLKSREEWEATQELMNDPEMQADVEEGTTQARRQEGRPWREIQKRVRS